MQRTYLALIATLVLTLAMAAPARAANQGFLGFYDTDWFYHSGSVPIGSHPPGVLATAADLNANQWAPTGVWWRSPVSESQVYGVVNARWGSLCGLAEYALKFNVYSSNTHQFLGQVVIAHLAGNYWESDWDVGDSAWHGVYIDSEYDSNSVPGSCNTGPHVHIEQDNSATWINVGGQNNSQQAALRWDY